MLEADTTLATLAPIIKSGGVVPERCVEDDLGEGDDNDGSFLVTMLMVVVHAETLHVQNTRKPTASAAYTLLVCILILEFIFRKNVLGV